MNYRGTQGENTIYAWVSLMTKMQARACVISRITGISSAEARRIWHAENKRSSPSGQQPNDLNWFLKTSARRSHSAILLCFYWRAKQTLPEYAAFAHAYYHYARLTAGDTDPKGWVDADPAFRSSEGDYLIPFSRGHYLATVYTDETRLNGDRKCPLRLRRCKICEGIYLSEESETSRICPVCSENKAKKTKAAG